MGSDFSQPAGSITQHCTSKKLPGLDEQREEQYKGLQPSGFLRPVLTFGLLAFTLPSFRKGFSSLTNDGIQRQAGLLRELQRQVRRQWFEIITLPRGEECDPCGRCAPRSGSWDVKGQESAAHLSPGVCCSPQPWFSKGGEERGLRAPRSSFFPSWTLCQRAVTPLSLRAPARDCLGDRSWVWSWPCCKTDFPIKIKASQLGSPEA